MVKTRSQKLAKVQAEWKQKKAKAKAKPVENKTAPKPQRKSKAEKLAEVKAAWKQPKPTGKVAENKAKVTVTQKTVRVTTKRSLVDKRAKGVEKKIPVPAVSSYKSHRTWTFWLIAMVMTAMIVRWRGTFHRSSSSTALVPAVARTPLMFVPRNVTDDQDEPSQVAYSRFAPSAHKITASPLCDSYCTSMPHQ